MDSRPPAVPNVSSRLGAASGPMPSSRRACPAISGHGQAAAGPVGALSHVPSGVQISSGPQRSHPLAQVGVPQLPPQPSLPQERPAQSGVQSNVTQSSFNTLSCSSPPNLLTGPTNVTQLPAMAAD